MCIPDGVLRAKLDGELAEVDSVEVDTHLAACGRCRARGGEIATRAEHVQELFSGLEAHSGGLSDTHTAFARLEARRRNGVESRGRLPWLRLTPAWGALAAIL